MATMKEITCACGCGRKRLVRLSDVKRGWGRYYSKSCKAVVQERRTGQYSDHLQAEPRNIRAGQEARPIHLFDWDGVEEEFHPFDPYSLGQE